MQAERSNRARLMQWLGYAVIGVLLIVAGYLFATQMLEQPAGANWRDALWRILFFPTLFLQLLLRIFAISIAVNVVHTERRKRRWDYVRTTAVGPELTLRTRWASVFYRLRGLFAVLIVVRLLLIVGILYDVTAFRGEFLGLLTAHIQPETSVIGGVILLACFLTASFLLPFTSIGVDASLGLLIASTVKSRTFSVILQGLLILFRVAIAVVFLFGMIQLSVALFGDNASLADSDVTPLSAWVTTFGFDAFVGWGMTYLQLSAAGEVWYLIPYGIFIGVALLTFSFVQAIGADLVLRLSVRFIHRSET